MTPEDERPRIFYGWIIVAVSFITVAIAGLARLSWSVMIVPIQETLGCTRLEVTVPASVGMLVLSIYSPYIGYLIDRFGARVVMPAGALVLGTGLVLTGYAQNHLHLYFTYGVIGSLGAASLLTVPHSAILANWFIRRRGQAIGIAFSAFGVGAILGLPAFQYAIERVGWKATYLVYSIILLLTVAPLTMMFHRRDPAEVGQRPDGDPPEPPSPPDSGPISSITVTQTGSFFTGDITVGRAMKTRTFWLLFMSSFLWGWRLIFIQTHQVAHMSACDFTPAQAAFSFALASFVMTFGNIIGGYLGDRHLGHRGGFLAGALLEVAGLIFLFTLTYHPWYYWIFPYAFFWGLGAGAEGPCFAAVTANAFGGRNRASIIGLINMPMGLGGAVGTYLAGFMFDQFGNYRIALGIAIGGAILSTFSVWFAETYARRQYSVNRSAGAA